MDRAGGIRTLDLPLRRRSLYPAELQPQNDRDHNRFDLRCHMAKLEARKQSDAAYSRLFEHRDSLPRNFGKARVQ